MALGYQGDDAKTAESFVWVRDGACSVGHFHPMPSDGRWYRTGDLGWFDNTGLLVLAGRVSSPTIGGVSVDVLETALEDGIEAVELCCIFHHGASLSCVVRAAHDCESLRTGVATLLAEQLPSAVVPPPLMDVIVDTEDWTFENGMLTATLKKCKAGVKHKHQIQARAG